MGILAHGALLAVLAVGLIVSPLGVGPVAGGEIAVAAPIVAFVPRPQVDLEGMAVRVGHGRDRQGPHDRGHPLIRRCASASRTYTGSPAISAINTGLRPSR